VIPNETLRKYWSCSIPFFLGLAVFLVPRIIGAVLISSAPEEMCGSALQDAAGAGAATRSAIPPVIQWPATTVSANGRVPSNATELRRLGLLSMWETSFSLFAIACAVLGVAAVVIICRMRRSESDGQHISRRTRRARNTLLIWMALISFVGLVIGLIRNSSNQVVRHLLSNTRTYGGADTVFAYGVLDVLSQIILFVVAIAFSMTLLPIAEKDETAAAVKRLREAFFRQQVLFYLSVFCLVILVVQNNLLWRWPAAWASEAEGKVIEELATRNSTSLGAMYSVLVLALFLPSHLLLSRYTRALARNATPADAPADPDEWLKKQDLKTTLAQHLAWFAAAMAPVLAGGPLASIVSVAGGAK
jgi:hypothetical protein